MIVLTSHFNEIQVPCSHSIHVWYIYLHFPYFTIKNQPNVGKQYQSRPMDGIYMGFSTKKHRRSTGGRWATVGCWGASFQEQFEDLDWQSQFGTASACLGDLDFFWGWEKIRWRWAKQPTMGTHISFIFRGYKVITHILGCKTFIFPWVFGVQGNSLLTLEVFFFSEVYHWAICPWLPKRK